MVAVDFTIDDLVAVCAATMSRASPACCFRKRIDGAVHHQEILAAERSGAFALIATTKSDSDILQMQHDRLIMGRRRDAREGA